MLYLAISICLSLLLLATAVRSKMAKIGNDTSYPKKTTPVGADTVIGTDSQDNEATKQFTVQGIVDLAQGGGTIPDLQAVLSSGDTATEDINLTGDITSTTLTSPTITSTSLISGNIIQSTGGIILSSGTITTGGSNGNQGQTLVSNGGLSPTWEDLVFKVQVSLTPAQILTLDTTPVQIVAAPGLLRSIQVISAALRLDFNSVQYDFPDPIKLGTYTGVSEEGQFTINAGSINANGPGYFCLNQQTVDNARLSENTALSIYTDNPPATTNGNSNCFMQVMYRIVTL